MHSISIGDLSGELHRLLAEGGDGELRIKKGHVVVRGSFFDRTVRLFTGPSAEDKRILDSVIDNVVRGERGLSSYELLEAKGYAGLRWKAKSPTLGQVRLATEYGEQLRNQRQQRELQAAWSIFGPWAVSA